MFPPLDVSNLFLAYLALVFGTSLVFLLGGGWRQLLGLLKPEAGAAAATLASVPAILALDGGGDATTRRRLATLQARIAPSVRRAA